MPFVTCSKLATELALKQGKLKKCDGTDLPDGANVPLCSEIPALVTANETTTTVVETPGQKTWSYNNEDATTKVLNNSQIVSANAGNAIAIGTDGGLMLSIPAQLPDDQVLSGDNTGTVALTLTPTTVNAGTPDEKVNYTIKADLKVAATTPDSETNLLQSSASGFYVDADSVMTAIAGDTTALATLTNAIGATAAETIAGTIDNKMLSPADLKAWYDVYKPGVLFAVKTSTNTPIVGGANTTQTYDVVETNTQTCGTFDAATGIYTASKSCVVSVSAIGYVVFSSATSIPAPGYADRDLTVRIRKNGVIVANSRQTDSTASLSSVGKGEVVSAHVSLAAGDTLLCEINANFVSAVGATFSSFGSRFSNFSLTAQAV